MQLSPIFSFFLAVDSLAIEQRSCVSSDVIAVAQQATDPHYFCAWYLSDGRTKSPIQNIDANALLTACECITSVEPAGTRAKHLNAIAKAARLQSFVSATCSSTSRSSISKEFKDPSSSCSFFNSYKRHDSPIPNINVPAARHACTCILERPKTFTKSSSTTSVSTSARRSSSRSSSSPSSSSKKLASKISLTLSTGTSSKTFVTTSARKTSTIKSSPSEFSSSQSSPLSTSTSSSFSSSETTSRKISLSTGSSSKTPPPNQTFSSKTSLGQTTPSKTSSVPPITVKSNTPLEYSSLSTSSFDPYNIITSEGLESFCTTYLDYTIPLATTTVSAFATMTERNNFTLTTTVTTTSVSTKTDINVVTMSVVEALDKRSMATPNALAAYPGDVISPACSRAVILPATLTIAETTTLTSIKAIAITTLIMAYEIEVSIVTERAASTTTATSSVYRGTPCGNQPYGALWEGPTGQFYLYCNNTNTGGYSFYGMLAVTDMAECLSHCADPDCTSATVDNGMCLLYGGGHADLGAAMYGPCSAAIRV